MRICFLITTYGRQESCQRLVDALHGLGDIIVLNDGCDYEIKGCTQIFQQAHNGRVRYWQTINNLFRLRVKSDYYVMLPDDFITNGDNIQKAIEIWEGIDDPRKICLNLYLDRIGKKCWTGFTPQKKNDLWLTQWVDMCFLCESRFFAEVGVMSGGYFRHIGKGSGVGSYISRRLYAKKFNLYQVTESLATHTEIHYKSMMHDKENIPDSYIARKINRSKRIFK